VDGQAAEQHCGHLHGGRIPGAEPYPSGDDIAIYVVFRARRRRVRLPRRARRLHAAACPVAVGPPLPGEAGFGLPLVTFAGGGYRARAHAPAGRRRRAFRWCPCGRCAASRRRRARRPSRRTPHRPARAPAAWRRGAHAPGCHRLPPADRRDVRRRRPGL